MLTRLRGAYGNPNVLITENGCSDPLSATAPAILNDGFRIDYLRRHLEIVKVAMEKGSPIQGYFVWTLVDNWEWDQGFTAKFGMCAMDRATGVRTPKASYAWLTTLAKTMRLPAAAG
jgi:beta-glucosidase